ncbi:hypothetical protein NE237_004398 [Protea cynaroides]|uniref:RING-type E3 ubiquitin transferase n=1 Tax=Protea cynaroides TaxID=273540 RepID=A0A9Q0KIT9_9MAGN|nr:hypothetical protein NE237_004398 [Protea cynaroides]
MVVSGRTFDRANIQRWINAGKTTCPVTKETISSTDLIPDKTMKEQIDKWSKEQGIYLKPSQRPTMKMTAAFIVEKLVASMGSPAAAANSVVRELIDRARLGAHIGEYGALPILLHLLHTDDDPGLQADSILAVRELVSMEPNKREIMEAEGGVDAIAHVLNCENATLDARADAAFTLYQLSTVEMYRCGVSRVSGLVSGLVKIVREGPAWARGKALAGVLSLGSDEVKEEEVRRLVKAYDQGETEEVVKVVMVYPVPQLLRDMRLTWTKRKLRRKATLLLEICYTWVCTWDWIVGPGFDDEDRDPEDNDTSLRADNNIYEKHG